MQKVGDDFEERFQLFSYYILKYRKEKRKENVLKAHVHILFPFRMSFCDIQKCKQVHTEIIHNFSVTESMASR